MPRWICVEFSLSHYRLLDFFCGNFVFFGDPVRNHCGEPVVEKIKDSVIHMPKTNAEFINAISQQIRFRSPKFMPELGKSLNAHGAFIESALLKRSEPFENRNAAVIFFVKDYPCLRHRR